MCFLCTVVSFSRLFMYRLLPLLFVVNDMIECLIFLRHLTPFRYLTWWALFQDDDDSIPIKFFRILANFIEKKTGSPFLCSCPGRGTTSAK